MRAIFWVVMILSTSSVSCKGALVQPALVLTMNPSGPKADYSLGDGGHDLYFNLSQSGVISEVTFTVGGGFAFYSVTNLTSFDVPYLQANQPFAGNAGNGGGSLQTPLNVPFYLGYYIQNSFPSQTIQPTASDGYGWAELIRGSSGLSLVDSAVQNPSGGIIVGTTNAVPEPSSLSCLSLLGGALTFLFRKVRVLPS